MGVSVKVDLSGVDDKIKSIKNNRKVGLFMASTFERGMNKYVPMDTGMLAQSAVTEPFKVTYDARDLKYNQPYAERIYNGDDLNFNKEKNPLATAYWDKAFINANRDKVAREISTFIKKGNF